VIGGGPVPRPVPNVDGMTAPSRTFQTPSATAPAGPRRIFAIFVGLTVLVVFLQSITAGEFISDGLPGSAKHTWTDVHGFLAYPIMVFALVAALAATRLRSPGTAVAAWMMFVLSVLQWLLGHAITTLGWDWVTPFHVVLAFIVYGLAIWLSVRSAALRRVR
jgi:heme A synthase